LSQEILPKLFLVLAKNCDARTYFLLLRTALSLLILPYDLCALLIVLVCSL
jgi:hypothetical protein